MTKTLKCKDYRYFMNGENIQMCRHDSYWEITEPDNDCVFLPKIRELTCRDCWQLENSFECMGEDPDQSIFFQGSQSPCPWFIDYKEDEFISILSFWKSTNLYDRDKINRLINDFEKNYDDLAGQIQ